MAGSEEHVPIAPIRSARKINASISERTASAQSTFQRASRIAAAKGVTRLADITGLDRIGIPVYTAVVPQSDDPLSVYNGKGLLPIDAQTGALMESIERQTAIYTATPIVNGSYVDLRNAQVRAIDPRAFNLALRDDYTEHRAYEWMRGWDLIQQETVLVPAGLCGFGPRFGPASPFPASSTNGLASGNCIEEAICHGLCELVERDAWTLAEMRSTFLPAARREARFGPDAVDAGIDDCNAYPCIDLDGAGWPVDELMAKFETAGLRPVVRDITSDFGIACVIASAIDDSVPGFPQAHSGLGCHPVARIAVVRALTELAQSRAVDIQGVREDILPPEATPEPHQRHTQRLRRIDHRRWILRDEGPAIPLRQVRSTANEDIAEDIHLILSAFVSDGLERAIVIDLSEPGGFAVVRVIVPGLEFWIIDHGKIGERALRFWKRHAGVV